MFHQSVRDRRLLVQCAVLAASLTASGMSNACSLDTLLRLPLEQLLDLVVGQPGCTPGWSKAGKPGLQMLAGGAP